MPEEMDQRSLEKLLAGAGQLPTGAILDPQPMQPPVPPGIVMKKPPNAVFPLPPAPASNSLIAGARSWSPLGNTKAGDCTIACVGHVIQVAAWHARAEEVTITEDECLDVYSKLSGWKRGDPTEGPGVFVRDGLNYGMNTGLGGRKITGWYRSQFLPGNGRYKQDRNCFDQDMIRRSMSVFGSVVIAIDLPVAVARWPGSAGPWIGRNLNAPIAGGHCIPIIGYDASWFYCITWGMVVAMDWDFLYRFTRELYVAYADDWMTTSGSSPDNHFSTVALSETMATDEAAEIMPVVP